MSKGEGSLCAATLSLTASVADLSAPDGVAAYIKPGQPVSQDAFLYEPEKGYAAVFDGMGGHSDGAAASKLGIALLKSFIEEHDSPAQALAAVQAQYRVEALMRRLGDADSTAVLASVDELKERGQRNIKIAWLGDSRAYLLQSCGRVSLATNDHSERGISDAIKQQLDNVIDEAHASRIGGGEMAFAFRRRNIVGAGLSFGTPGATTCTVGGDTRVMLCSDGIHDNLTSAEIHNAWNKHEDKGGHSFPAKLAEMAWTRSRSDHGRAKPDDITCLIL